MITLGISDDYELFDNPGSCKLIRATGEETLIEDAALNSPFTANQIANSGGTYSATDRQWSFPTVIAGNPPQIDDVIVDEADGSEWSIFQTDIRCWDTRYWCACKRTDKT